MASIMNCMVHVYHCAPVFSVMEVECVLKFASMFGFNTATADGCLNPGGSMSNMMALLAARHENFPHVREQGWLPEDKPVAFCADLSHYSLKRGAMVCGMGMNQMVAVPCSRETGRMIPEEFERLVKEAIAKGQKPFFVNSLGGSTVFGAFDDFAAISEIAHKYGMWHHVDGCWGGFLIFSERCRNTIWKGIETVDSVSCNPHKGLSVPGQCALLLTNNKKGAL
jgi:glutamate/tyrosine decarboxylase-like PLP-dependent enzyme